MGAIKGFSTQERKSEETFATVQLLDGRRGAVDVLTSYATKVNAIPKNVGIGSTLNTVVSAAHGAIAGNMVRFIDGPNIGLEMLIIASDLNTFTVAGELYGAPVVGNTFDILRRVTPTVGPDGQITVTVTTLPVVMVGGVWVDFAVTNINPVNTAVHTLLTNIKKLQIVNQTGNIFYLAVNGVDVGVIFPGAEIAPMEFASNAGDIIQLRTTAGVVNVGNFFMNFFN